MRIKRRVKCGVEEVRSGSKRTGLGSGFLYEGIGRTSKVFEEIYFQKKIILRQ